MTMRAGIAGIAVWGPGIEGWAASCPILAGHAPYVPRPVSLPTPTILSANERRRTGAAVRLALTVAQEATQMAGIDPAGLRSVFGSSNGDGAVVHAILDSLAGRDRTVSPTQFHNSVHNAAAGYWTIAIGSRAAATCLGCHDATFAAALLKAMAEVAAENEPVLLCVYDAPIPPPLGQVRVTDTSFAAAFVLMPSDQSGACRLGALSVAYEPEPAPPSATLPRQPALRALATTNPAARALRLLEALALGVPDRLSAGLLDGRLDIAVASA